MDDVKYGERVDPIEAKILRTMGTLRADMIEEGVRPLPSDTALRFFAQKEINLIETYTEMDEQWREVKTPITQIQATLDFRRSILRCLSTVIIFSGITFTVYSVIFR